MPIFLQMACVILGIIIVIGAMGLAAIGSARADGVHPWAPTQTPAASDPREAIDATI